MSSSSSSSSFKLGSVTTQLHGGQGIGSIIAKSTQTDSTKQQLVKQPVSMEIDSKDSKEAKDTKDIKDIKDHKDNNETAHIHGRVGMINLGNTCFFNSTFQVLRNYRKVTEVFLHKDFFEPLKNNKRIELEAIKVKRNDNIPVTEQEILSACWSSVSVNTYKLFKTMWEQENMNVKIKPVTLLQSLAKTNRMFGTGYQQDAREALTFILDDWHTETAQPVTISLKKIDDDCGKLLDARDHMMTVCKGSSLLEDKKKEIETYKKLKAKYPNAVIILKSYKAWSNYINKYGYSFVTKLFVGLLHSELQCRECSSKSNKFDIYNEITVEIPNPTLFKRKENTYVTLNECMDMFCSNEALDDDNKWNCPVCEKRVNVTKKFKLWTAPPLLIIVLKRFSRSMIGSNRIMTSKNNTLVNFPMELDIIKYLDPLNTKKKSMKYDLISVVNQHGSLEGGHYFSYAKNYDDGKFYLYNDSSVSVMNDDDVVTSGAYILCYQLKE